MKDKMKEPEFDLQIDEHELDQEWVAQPSLYFRYAAKLADARRDWEEAKASLDVTKAELDDSIRRNPAAYEVAKVTERTVEAATVCQQEYQAARQSVIDAHHVVGVMEAAVGALDSRKKALEKLVELHLANYFSRPRAPEGAKEKMADVEKAAVRRKGRRQGSD